MRAAGTPVPQNTMLASAVHGWATRPSFRKSPQARAPAVHLGGFKFILGQIIGQTELLIFLILGWGTNEDLVVSRIGVDIVVFPISLHQRHFIWRERLELLLPLRSVSNDGSEACSREQVLCVLRISATHSQG